MTEPNSTAGNESNASQTPTRRKRRWPKVLGVVVILLIALVLLLPTIVSLPPVRAIILSQASGYINGKVEVSSWSLGWFSALKIEGVKVYDDKNSLILEANKIETEATLLKLARGSLDFGKTTVAANLTRLVIHPDGHTNLETLVKKSSASHEPPKPSTTGDSASIPDVKVDLLLDLRGSVELVDATGKPISNLQLRQGSGGTVKIADINQGVQTDLKLVYDVDQRPASTIQVVGSVDAVDGNKLNLVNLASQMKIALTAVDIGAAKPVLALAGMGETQVDGIASGELNADLKPGQAGAATGEIQISKVRFATPQMLDVYQADLIKLPVNVTRNVVDGKSRLKIDVKAMLPEASASVTGDLPELALVNLGAQKLPGDTGQLNIYLQASQQKIAAALPKTMRLLPDVQITGGDLQSNIYVGLKPDRIETATKSSFMLSGTRAGRAQSIAPVTINTSANVTDLASLAKGVRDLSAHIASDFVSLNISGATVTDVKGDGSADLDKLSAQVAQFVDIGDAKMAGKAAFTLRNVATEGSANDYTLTAGGIFTGINVQLPNVAPIDLKYVKGDLSSSYIFDPAAASPLKQIKTAAGSLVMGNSADKPVLDGSVKLADIDLANLKIGQFNIEKGTITDLAALQKMIDPFVLQLREQGINLMAGQVYVVGNGSADLQAKSVTFTKLDISTPGLQVSKAGKELLRDKFTISTAGMVQAGDILKADLSSLSVDSAIVKINKSDTPLKVQLVSGVPQGSGGINVEKIDLTLVSRVMQALSTEPVNNISSGTLKGTLTLATDDKHSTANFTGGIDGLTIDQTPISNQPVTFGVNADLPASLDRAAIVLNLRSAYADVDAKDVSLNLAKGTPAFKMVEKGTVVIGMKDFANAYAMAAALAPAMKLPFTPTSGGVAINANIDKSRITANIEASRLALRNEKGQTYTFDRKQPVVIAADATWEGGDKLDSLTVSKLRADVGAVLVEMVDPIVVNNLQTTPAAKGKLKITGTLDRVTPLLAFVQQADMPMPYRGAFDLTNTLGTSGNTTTALIDGNITDFVLLDEITNKPAFTEKQIKITGDLSADLKQQNAQIKSLDLTMVSSQAAKVNITGGVSNFGSPTVGINNVVARIDAVGEKAWPIVFPLLPPEQQEKLKTAKIAGPISVNITANGAYITDKPMYVAIKPLVAKGDIRLASADLTDSYGLTIANFRQLVSIRDGVLVTGDTDKPKGDANRFAPPFDINGGKGDLGSVAINLADPAMPVTVGRKQKVLVGVQSNRVMAAQLGVIASVLFKDAKEASGIVDLTVMDCNNVPLADLMTGSKKAKATVLYNVKDLHLDGFVTSGLASVLGWGKNGIDGDIENGSLTLENGIAYQNMTLRINKSVKQVDKSGKSAVVEVPEDLMFKGGVDLEKLTFKDYSLWISQGLLPNRYQKGNPNGATVELRGKVDDMTSVLGQALIQLGLQTEGGNLLDDLLNKNKKKDR